MSSRKLAKHRPFGSIESNGLARKCGYCGDWHMLIALRRCRHRATPPLLVRFNMRDGSTIFFEAARHVLLVSPLGGLLRAAIPCDIQLPELALVDWDQVHSWIGRYECTDILKNDAAEFVINLTAFSPGSDRPRSRRPLTTDLGVGTGANDSPIEDTTVTIRYNKATGEASEGDVARIHRFLSASTQFGLLTVALPTLAKQVASPGKVANGVLGCIGMIFAYIGAMIAFVAGCGVPEPLEPFACAASVLAFIGAGVALVDSCAV